MAYLTEKLTKLENQLKKSKKHGKKRDHDSLDSDSDSDQDNGSGSTGNLVDKRLKLNQPSGIHLKSADTRPIKATKLAHDIIKANESAIENSKTGKVTAVIAILKVFGDKFTNSRSANPEKLRNKPNKWVSTLWEEGVPLKQLPGFFDREHIPCQRHLACATPISHLC